MNLRVFKNLTKMATAPFRERGFVETVRSVRGVIHARRQDQVDAFDDRFGTDTDRRVGLNDLDASGPDVPPLWRYWPTLEAPFRRLMGALEVPHQEFAFVDLGSGKGRVLLMASELPFARIVGVEISPALCRIAERNLRAYRSPSQRCFDFELACMDAARYRPPEENAIVYLFQPFPAATMAAVLDNLTASLRHHPRRMAIAYMNPLFDRMIVDTGLFAARTRGTPIAPGEFAWAVYANWT
jgi:SAM-dependent methyltransferase